MLPFGHGAWHSIAFHHYACSGLALSLFTAHVIKQDAYSLRRIFLGRVHDNPNSNYSGFRSQLHHQRSTLSKICGASEVYDYKDPSSSDRSSKRRISQDRTSWALLMMSPLPDTYANNRATLADLKGGHLVCVHSPPEKVPENVKAGVFCAVNDVATPVWKDYVTPALQSGTLKCLPAPLVAGKDLEIVQEALKKCEAGACVIKLVVELWI